MISLSIDGRGESCCPLLSGQAIVLVFLFFFVTCWVGLRGRIR